MNRSDRRRVYKWKVLGGRTVTTDVIWSAIHTMVAATESFLQLEEDVRSSATVNETIATSSMAIVCASVVFTLGFRANGAALFLLSASIVLCIVASCVSLSLIWSLAIGRRHVVHITADGIKWDDQEFDWSAVRRIRTWNGPTPGRTTLTFTIARPGLRSQLALPIRVPNSRATALRDELRVFLSASGYNVRWVN